MRVGIYIGDSLKSSRIADFINEYFNENCFIYAFLSVEEIYLLPQCFDILFLDTNEIDNEIFEKIRENIDCDIILLDNKTVCEGFVNIPLLFNKGNYEKVLKMVINGPRKVEKFIHFKLKNEKKLISMNDILYIHGVNKEITVYLKNTTTFKACEYLRYFYQRLNDERFLMVHNEYIINMDYSVVPKDKYYFICNGTTIPVRNYGKDDIIKKFLEYKFKKMKKQKGSAMV